jgi:uncharacterized SAM-binding protein YcdF (DUF218 family)
MTIVWFIKNLFGALLLPPGNGLLLLGIAGVFRKKRWAFGLSLVAGALLFAQSLPVVSQRLISSLEQTAGPVVSEVKGAGAIVVLGSSLNFDAPEYGGDTANERTLVRLRYGAYLARKHDLPVLVSGGKPLRASKSEAAVMAEIMANELGVKVRWREMNSMDTADNARMSAEILSAAGIKRIVLVTQAFHMPRSRLLFEQAGFEVIAGPTGFKGLGAAPSVFDWIPSASAMQNSYYALHEWLGIAWAKLSQRH